MSTVNDTSIDSLSPAQEFSTLISNILSKEVDFLANENIETLHDFRVDLRKLRTWIKIMDLAGYSIQKLKKYSLHCHYIGGELRNFDVLLHWANQHNDLISLKLLKTLNKKKKQLRKTFLKELIHGNALHKIQTSGHNFISQIQELSKEDLEPHVRRYIAKKIESAYRLVPTVCDNTEQLHEMRKIFKKIRYSLQLLPASDLEYLHTIKEIQEILGYINDRRVWITLLESLFDKNKEAAALITVFKSEMHAKIETFRSHILNEVDNPIGNFMKR